MTAPAVDLRLGDNRDVLRALPDESVSAIICDPPYEIAFMGKQWDASGIAYDVDLWRECLRVAKPGAHLAAFGGTRTYHRVAVAIEDAGWEIRDSLMWLYGNGMAKSLDVSKAIDKRPGVQRHHEFAAHLAVRRTALGLSRADVSERVVGARTGACWNWEHHQFPEAKWWPALRELLDLDPQWGSVIAEAERKVIGTIRNNQPGGTSSFAQGGIGEYQRGDTRARVVLGGPSTPEAAQWSGWGTAVAPAHEPIVLARKPLSGTVAGTVLEHGTGAINAEASKTSEGRWPKNVIIDEHVAADLGDRARYFYCAKAPTSERPKIDGKGWPAVKPVALMRWLVRLLAPPGGLVVDPFAGTGTTLQAARDEGFPSLGVEADEFAYRLACQRIATSTPTPTEPSLFDDLDRSTA